MAVRAVKLAEVSPGVMMPDGGASACRVVKGPLALPVKAPATLSDHGDVVDAVLNEDGHPRVVSLPADPIPPGPLPVREIFADAVATGLSLRCAMAGDIIFCPDRDGAVHRARRTGGDDHVVASSRKGSRISACTFGPAHAAFAYMASRATSEGWVSEAWLGVDDEPPVRISEDGSGATAVTLAPRGESIMALMIDARAALTAMHARPLTYDASLHLGEDAVIFVGGPGDRGTAGALAAPRRGPAWALLPTSEDVGHFGVAIVQMHDPPQVDEPVSWLLYPNGLDPAPIATAWGRERIWVGLIRPSAPQPKAPRILEIGDLRQGASFRSIGVISTHSSPSDVSLAIDSHAALWVAWVDAAGSWVERLACK
ncbi:MAG: hypothetical protein ABSC94_23205 [Polyangiaceae bacterium]|jgi:hypothetical protein